MNKRYNEEYGIGGFNPSLPDNNLVSREEIPYSWEEIRELREPLLVEADILINRATDLSLTAGNVNADYLKALSEYRMALRDITKTYENPNDVEWPVKPEVIV